MKEYYEDTEIEIIDLNLADVIRTSTGIDSEHGEGEADYEF